MTENPQDHQSQQPTQGPQPGESTPPFSPQAPQHSGPQPSYQAVPLNPADQRTWAIGAHLSPFLALFVGMTFLGPLVIYIIFKDRGAFIRHHSAGSLNFQLTAWIGLLFSLPLMLIGIGFLTFFAILLAMLVFQILGAVAASEGRDFKYPLTIPFVS